MKTKKLQSTIFKEKLEKFDREILNDSIYKDIVKKEIGGKPGIYILYNKKGDIYYIGKANEIMTRIMEHKNNRHSKKWEKFSVFLTKKASHLDHLETAFISIINPKGNAQNRRTIPSSMEARIKRAMKKEDAEYRNTMYERKFASYKSKRKSTKTVKKKRSSKKSRKMTPCLKNYFKNDRLLIGRYKEKTYKAILLKSGEIEYENKIYSSINQSAIDALKKASGRDHRQGSTFWHVRKNKNTWVKLNDLRNKK